MTAALHIIAIVLSAMCLASSLVGLAHRNKITIWGDAIMVVTMVAAVMTEDAAAALLGAVLLVGVAISEAILLRRSRTLTEASRVNIIHRSLCFIAMAFLFVTMLSHSQQSSSTHGHQGVFMPALLSLTGAALIMAAIIGVRQLRLLATTGAGSRVLTHYVIESGGMVAATTLMLMATLVGH